MATVNTTDPKPGYVYNSDDDTWYPLLGISNAQALSELSDVSLSTPTTGQVLAYDGTNWVNSAEAGDISSVTAGTGLTGGGSSGAVTLSLSTPVSVANGGTGITSFGTGIATFLGTPSSANLASALTDETGSGSAVFGTSPTITTATLNQPVMVSPEERVNVVASAATGTVALDALTAGTMLYTSNATGNWTLNVRGSATTSLNTILTTGDSITVVFLVTNGSTAYYHTAFQIDGASVTPKWQGGTAPSAGNASSIDAYVFNIIKTASATYTVLGSQTKFA